MDKTYDFKFVETVIQLDGSISRGFKEKFFDWCDENDISGIDGWRDFIIEAATKFEDYTRDIDWNVAPPTDYITAVDEFAAILRMDECGAAIPSKDAFVARINRKG